MDSKKLQAVEEEDFITATGSMGGHPTEWDDDRGIWVYRDTRELAPDEARPCTHCDLKQVPVAVVIPRGNSSTGKTRVAIKPVDACVADLVRRLNAGATEPVTTASCCGHGNAEGCIILADGRRLIIRKDQADRRTDILDPFD